MADRMRRKTAGYFVTPPPIFMLTYAVRRMDDVSNSGTENECELDTEFIANESAEGGHRRRWRWKRSSASYSAAPRDRGYVVYVCMVLAGAGFLFPWSSYITAIDYFFFLYRRDFPQVLV